MVLDHYWSNDAMVSMDRCGLLEILILNHVSRVPSCEISGPDDSKNVEFNGSGIFRRERKLLSLKVNYKKPLWTIVFYEG